MSLTRVQRGFLDTGAVIVPDNLYTTTGTASSSTFLRGDGTWAVIASAQTATNATTATYAITAGVANAVNTTSNIQVQSLTSTAAVSAGGLPVDANGRVLIETANTQSAALIVSNYSSGLLPRVHIRGWGQNTPGGTTTTPQSTSILIDGARGTPAAPLANKSGDLLAQIGVSGYDGNNYVSSSTLQTFSLFVQAAEDWNSTVNTTTNAGISWGMRIQPPRVWLTATSRPLVLNFTWSTSTTAPPVFNMGIGQGYDTTVPTLTDSATGAQYTGYGRNNIISTNAAVTLYSVTTSDLSPDNTSITGSGANTIVLSSNRRNGVIGRRMPLLANDNLSAIYFGGQTVPNGTTTGVLPIMITGKALDNFTSTQYGAQFSINTVNSGTTISSTRLQLDNLAHYYNSNKHVFRDAALGATAVVTVSGAVIADNMYVGVWPVSTATGINTSTTQVAYATTAGYAVSFNTGTLVTTAVSLLNTSTTQVGYATTAGFAVTFNTATLVTTAVSLLNTSTTQVGYATTAGFAVTFNTGTLIAQAVDLINTATTQVGYATTASTVVGSVFDTVYTLGNVSGTLTPSISSGTVHNYTLTGNITLNALSNAVAGSNITLILKQDAVGGRTMTSTMKWANGSKTLSTIASSTDIVSVFYDGTNYWASLGRGFV